MLEKEFAFTMCTKYRKIFTEQVQTAHPNVSDADVDTIIETHFADWLSQNVSKLTYSLKIFGHIETCIVLTKITSFVALGTLHSAI